MSSKIFKSSYMSDSSRLEIEASIASTSFHITHCTVVGEKSFMFDNTTAPALALAILEAAGVVPTQHSDSVDEGSQETLEDVMYWLTRHVRSAEAKAELEAEALVLENARCEALEVGGFNSFDDLPAHKQVTGLAVARKAREMRKS